MAECSEKTFLNSWNWGEFQAGQGGKVWRLGVESNSQLRALALAVKIKARRGTFLLIQHGPCVKDGSSADRFAILEELLGELVKIGKKEGVFFVRMNPLWVRNSENGSGFKKLGFVEAPMHANAYEATWKLDIAPSEEDLMRGMRKTTRYLIKQAQKNPGLSIEKSENLNDAAVYGKLNEEVAARQKFTPFSSAFIEREFATFLKDNEVLWLFGKYRDEIAAGALVIFWQGAGYYHQAASLSKYAKLSIPYLLQWEAICEAKKRGCLSYDFWGYTDPQKYPNHPWAGPTLFKMGFGGKASEYALTQDYPLSPLYWPVHYFEKIRKAKRKL